MKALTISISLFISTLAMGAKPVVCNQIDLEKEVAVYLKSKQAFTGECLEKVLNKANTYRDPLNDFLVVLEIQKGLKQDATAAQIKAEIFEGGLNPNGDSFLDEEADLKRLNPLLDENGDFRE